MKKIIDRIFHCRISRDKARDIVRHSLLPASELFHVTDKAMIHWHIYKCWDDEPVWYVTIPSDTLALQSTRVAVVSKKSGKILAVVSANDEG